MILKFLLLEAKALKIYTCGGFLIALKWFQGLKEIVFYREKIHNFINIEGIKFT